METGKGVLGKKGTNEVVVTISSEDEDEESKQGTESGSYSFSKNHTRVEIPNPNNRFSDSNLELTELDTLTCKVQTPTFTNPSSSPITNSSPILNKPPKIPTEPVTRRRSLTRSAYSKPKSRLVEPTYSTKVEETTQLITPKTPPRNSPNLGSSPINKVTVTNPKDNVRSIPVTPKTPLIAAAGEDEEDDDEVYTAENVLASEKSGKKYKFAFFTEWTAFVSIMGFLIACLTVNRLQNEIIWGLKLWRWCVLVLVIFCGRLFAEWFINLLVFLIERNFLLRKKVLYFVYGLKRSVQVFIYLGLVLLAWGLLFDQGAETSQFERSKRTIKVLNYITRGLACCLLGAFIWMLKTLFVKLLASSFHVKRFFDRIQESIFHQYVLQTLSGPPLMEMAENIGRTKSNAQLSFKSVKKSKGKEKEEVIDVEKLHKMKQEKISAWTMKGLVQVIRTSGLTTLSDTLEDVDDEGNEQKSEQITNEAEAKDAAKRIFRNVAKPGNKYIGEEDLLRFMKKEEVDNVFPLFDGVAETKKIKKSALRNWVVNVYVERKSLAFSLNDTKTAVEELNKIVSGIMLVVILIVWLLLMGFATTQVLVFISSQLLLVAFMFGNTCKTVFEAMIFVFIMHPFDVGDRCVIDGIQMVVEEMNILTTIFLRYDNEKIIYPNSVLATKPISNFYRSPEMGDSVEFSVDVSTSIETIGALKGRIKAYLEGKPQHWRPSHSVIVKDIEDMNKMKMALYVTHTINFQNSGEKGSRRSDLVIELKKFFEELGIKYHLLPQEVQVSYVGSSTSSFSPTVR